MNWIPIALAVATAILGVLSTILIKGFSAGKYLQRSEDHHDQIKAEQTVLKDRVTANEVVLEEIERSLHRLREETNRDVGKVQLTYELLQQRVEHQKERIEERRKLIDEHLQRIEEHVRHIDDAVRELQRPNHQRRS